MAGSTANFEKPISSSQDAHNSLIDLFSVEPTDMTAVATRFKEWYPKVNDGISFPIEFDIPPSVTFTDLSQSYFEVEMKVTKEAGGDLDDATVCIPVPNLMHSMWKQVSVWLNGHLITEQYDTYAPKAYIEDLLNHGPRASETSMVGQGWYLAANFPEEINATNIDSEHDHYKALPTNAQHAIKDGLKLKAKMQGDNGNGGKLILQGQPHTDIFHFNKLLIPNVKMSFKFDFNPITYWMKTPAGGTALKLSNYKIKFVQANTILNPSLSVALTKKIESNAPAYYTTSRTQLKVFNVASPLSEFIQDNIFENKIPHRVLICMQLRDNFNGTVSKSPFVFKKHKLKEYGVTINSEQYPTTPYTLNPDSTIQDIKPYNELLKCLGAYNSRSEDFPIQLGDWSESSAFLAWNFVPTGQADEGHLNPLITGQLRFHLKFAEPVPVNNILKILILGEFHTVMSISKQGITYSMS